MTNQTPNAEENVKVTIQTIEYTSSDSTLQIGLENNVPEKSLDGNITIYQDGKEWTDEVMWHYSGYGVAEVVCVSINKTNSFHITYIENNPKATYLEREIEWIEVEQEPIGFMETKELTITQMTFTTGNATIGRIVVSVSNTGTGDVTVGIVKVNGETITTDNWSAATSATVASGSSATVTITTAVTAGSKYSVTLYTTDGTLVGSYQDTA